MGRDEPGIDLIQPARPPKETGGEEFFAKGKLVTGDPDFKSVEVEIKIGWLK